MMEERALLAVIISILIIFLYQYYFVQRPLPKVEIDKKNVAKADSIKEEERKINISQINSLMELQNKRERKEYKIETEKFIVIIDNLGGKIKSWKLKEYKEEREYITWPLKMAFVDQVIQEYKNIFTTKKSFNDNKIDELVEIINDQKDNGYQLKIESINNIMNEENPDEMIYDIYNEEINDENNNRIKKISMSAITKNGIMINKEINFYLKEYTAKLNISIKNINNIIQNTNYTLIWGPGIGKGINKSSRHQYIGPVIRIDKKKERIKGKKIDSIIKKSGVIEWIGLENTYFAACIIPFENKSTGIIFKQKENNDDFISVGIEISNDFIKPGETIIKNYLLYVGPKKKEMLVKAGKNLLELIDYGWFSFLAKPMIYLLNLFYKFVPNYGIAIIILTILIKIIFWPLTEKSFKSMRDMQKIQPKMNALRQKYKDDPVSMNKEVMELYKRQGVNPIGGCLPMILQIPVFFALYEGLLVSIEMRGAPFFLWIKDLSVMDPLLVTPILMGITMYMQQKMMPTGMDPKQAKMMNLMPLIFTVFFLGFPSGLVIYWLLNNILTISHQYLIIRKQTESID